MRVIGGDARGRPLKAPRGLHTRPTSDLLRGAIFSMLSSMGIEPCRVLDLYAGTGALGIEALSRGAEVADFVDQSPAACAIIRENLESMGLTARARVMPLSVHRAPARLSGPYDVVFADPPYTDHSVAAFFALPVVDALVADRAVVVYEHSRRDSAPAMLGELTLMRTRSHGSSSVSFYRRQAEMKLTGEMAQ
jgi:16S rRNA (guanine966-N2)-methyltransferase